MLPPSPAGLARFLVADESPPLPSLLVDAGPSPPEASGGASTRGRLGLSEVVTLPPAAGVPGQAAGADRVGVFRRPRVVCGRGATPRPMARGKWSSPELMAPGGRLAVPPAAAGPEPAMSDESPSRGPWQVFSCCIDLTKVIPIPLCNLEIDQQSVGLLVKSEYQAF